MIVAPLIHTRMQLNADGTKCEVVTLVEVLDGLYAWDAAKEGIFDSKIMSAEPIAKDRKNSWFQWDCEGDYSVAGGHCRVSLSNWCFRASQGEWLLSLPRTSTRLSRFQHCRMWPCGHSTSAASSLPPLPSS